MDILEKTQLEHSLWAAKNFPNATKEMPLIGIMEELGELSHAHLKRMQGIRGNDFDHEMDARDAVGDILIFLIDYCTKQNWSITEILKETWAEVKTRDWQANPESGR